MSLLQCASRPWYIQDLASTCVSADPSQCLKTRIQPFWCDEPYWKGQAVRSTWILNHYGVQQTQRQEHYSTVGLSLCNRTAVLRMKIPPSINPSTPNDPYRGRTASLTSKRCILYIYSTNTGTEYFKHGIYYPFFSLQNTVCFIILPYLVPVLFAFYIQVC